MTALRFLLVACAAFAAQPPPPDGGVYVEEVTAGSEAGKAGIHPGDWILAWKAGTRSESIASPIDFDDLEAEYSTRSPINLQGRRGSAPQTWILPPGKWGITVRPSLSAERIAQYQQARGLASGRKYVEAAELLRRAAAEPSQGAASHAVWLLSEAMSLDARARRWKDADEAAAAALARAADAGPNARPWLLEQWAHTFYFRDWLEAERHLTEALDIRRTLDAESLSVANLTNSLGYVARNRGFLNKAETYYREALAMGERIAPSSLFVASTLNNVGFMLWKRGELVGAEESFQRSVSIREKLSPDDAFSPLNNLGAVAMREDNPAKAEKYWRQALALREKTNPLSPAIITILHNLGHVAEEQNRLEDAEPFYARELDIVAKLDPDGLEVASLLDVVGKLALRRGDAGRAEANHQRALAIREKLDPGGIGTAESFRNLGAVAENRGDWKRAEDQYRRELALREKLSPGTEAHSASLHHLGTVLRAQGETESATNLLAKAVDILERTADRFDGTEDDRLEYRALYAPVYRDYLESLLAQNRHAEAFSVLERSRARSLLAMIAERDLVLSADLPAQLKEERVLNAVAYDSVQAQINDLPGAQAARRQNLQDRLTGLAIEREHVEERIRRASPRLAALQYPQPLDLDGARRALDPGSLLLSYSVGTQQTALFVVQPDGADPGLPVFTLPIGESQLAAKVQQLRMLIEKAGPSKRAALDTSARELYDLLVKPAEAALESAKRLVIVPDGPLHTLPFAALLRTPGQYLIEWKPLHTVLSASLYAELRKMPGPSADSTLELLAFGAPAAPGATAAERGLTLGPLPFSRDEVRGIAALFPGRAQVFLGPEATEARAKSLMPRARRIHFATHALLDERLPLDSAVVLSASATAGQGRENGILQAWEILEQVRLNADLVVLSGCRSGLGLESRGEGLIGLARAFQYAGARSVLASLWPVDDRKTADLMTRFYTHLQSGKNKAEALRAAQVELIHRNASHPYYWAAFSLIGDWQ